MIADLVSYWRANGSFDKTQSSVWRSINERNTLVSITVSMFFDSGGSPHSAVDDHNFATDPEGCVLEEIVYNESWAEAQEVYFELLPEIELLTQQLVEAF
jgi:hypothetical protein